MDAYRGLRSEWPQLLRQCRPFLPSKLLGKSSLAWHHGGPRTVAKYNTKWRQILLTLWNGEAITNFLRDSLLLHRPIYLLHSTCTYFILFSLITYMICFCPVTHSTALFEHPISFSKRRQDKQRVPSSNTCLFLFFHLGSLHGLNQVGTNEMYRNVASTLKTRKRLAQIRSVIPLKLPWDKIECLTCCGTSFYRKSCLIRFQKRR